MSASQFKKRSGFNFLDATMQSRDIFLFFWLSALLRFLFFGFVETILSTLCNAFSGVLAFLEVISFKYWELWVDIAIVVENKIVPSRYLLRLLLADLHWWDKKHNRCNMIMFVISKSMKWKQQCQKEILKSQIFTLAVVLDGTLWPNITMKKLIHPPFW